MINLWYIAINSQKNILGDAGVNFHLFFGGNANIVCLRESAKIRVLNLTLSRLRYHKIRDLCQRMELILLWRWFPTSLEVNLLCGPRSRHLGAVGLTFAVFGGSGLNADWLCIKMQLTAQGPCPLYEHGGKLSPPKTVHVQSFFRHVVPIIYVHQTFLFNKVGLFFQSGLFIFL